MLRPAPDLAPLRAAVRDWRDEATIAAMTLTQDAAVATMAKLETRLDGIATTDALAAPAATARDIVRPVMREQMRTAGDIWFARQARALRLVDARIEPIALQFGGMDRRPPLPLDPTPSTSWLTTPAWVGTSVETIGSLVGQAATNVGSRMIPATVRDRATRLTDQASREIGERSGIRERLRAAGRTELARTWLGTVLPDDADQERPYLTQLLDMIDATAVVAGEALK